MIVDVRLGDGSGVSAVEEILRAGPVFHLFVSDDIPSVQAVAVQKLYRKSYLARAIQTAAGTRVYGTLRVHSIQCLLDL